MRQSRLTFEEIQAAEQASEKRRQSRNQGFRKMHDRDRAHQKLSNGITMLWHVDRELNKDESHIVREDGTVVDITVYPQDVPEECFGLVIDGKRYLFDLDEFRKWLRWA